ncbi:hypothetical protein AAU61_08045 [Desulfocarbo indianensis]|nr:hypothetical protein AAU61_08045 [Desulfocarbo indianensis]
MICLTGALSACSASLPRRPPQTGPFQSADTPSAGGDIDLFFIFLAGCAVGLLAALLCRWHHLRRGLQSPGQPELPRELRLARSALLLLEELLATWQRRGVVVRLRDWLKRRKEK